MRGIDVALSIMLAVCGLILLYLINISYTSSLLLSWNALAICGFLFGIVQYAIIDYSSLNRRRETIFMGWLSLWNIVVLWIIFNSLITDSDSVLVLGFITVMSDFLFSTPVLLLNFIKEWKPREESEGVSVSV